MKYTVTFRLDEDNPHDVLLGISAIYGYDSIQDLLDQEPEVDELPLGQDASRSAAPAPGGWTLSKMRRYATALQPNAQRILRVVAENAPEISVDDTRAEVGLEDYEYAGTMSSFGFAARKTRGVQSRPFDKVKRVYQINTEIAKLALSALDELGV